MPLTQETIDRFFANNLDLQIPGEQVPQTSSGNRVEHLIDGENYFAALSNEIDFLQSADDGRFFYFANWWAGLVETPAAVGSAGPFISAWTEGTPAPRFTPLILGEGCGGPQTGTLLIDRLVTLANVHDVDVRSLVWMSPVIMSELFASFAPGLNSPDLPVQIYWTGRAQSIRSAQTLRSRIGAGHVVLNTLAHPIGAWHVKMVVCGDATGIRAYVGGMDLVCDKYSQTTHPTGNIWHDAAVRVEGPAAIAIFEYFQQIWDEQRGRRISRFLINGSEVPSHYVDTLDSALAPVSVDAVSNIGTQWVQVLRTCPNTTITLPTELSTMNIIERILLIGTSQKPLSFAPDGQFEFRMALRKAISAAENYVYIEDQGFPGREIMEWLNARLIQVPNLKVIMLWGADPGDPANTYIRLSMEALTAGLSANDARSRVVFCEYKGVTVHSKIFIIDDVWATVGSSNCARRSLYLDAEIGVGVLDEASPTFAKRLRKDLWAEHCDIKPGTPESDTLLPIEQALGIWEPSWATTALPASVMRKTALDKKIIPFEYVDPPGPGQWATKFNQDRPAVLYDLVDGDSR